MTDKILADILERLAALEAAVFMRTGSPGDRKRTKNQVAEREGCSPRTIDRKVAQKRFPAPDIVENGRCKWWESTLERHDRERLREARKQPKEAQPAAR
jgi:hypothetical protein